MRKSQLTKKQRRLFRDIEVSVQWFGLDYAYILTYKPKDRTTRLEVTKDFLIRGQVIKWYTLLDEFLNTALCYHFFGRGANFIKLWESKRFRNFNNYLLEELSLLQKFRYVKGISRIPRNIAQDITRLNALRNGLAHAFFPENLKKSPPVWKGRSIFHLEGLKVLRDDVQKILDFFFKRFRAL